MSEPCPRCEGPDPSWAWQFPLDLVKAERDAAQAKVAKIETLHYLPAAIVSNNEFPVVYVLTRQALGLK